MAPIRYPRPFKQRVAAFTGGPRKPRMQQWFLGIKLGARFTCGLCHHNFTRRDNLNRYKMSCYSDKARLNGLLSECALRTNRDPRRAPTRLFPPKKGRPKHGQYACDKCGRILATA